MSLVVLEICAGGGGQALGLDLAGFLTAGAVEIDADACATLHANRPDWRIIQADVREVDGGEFRGIDVLAGGVPCPPFSIAGKQLGRLDERDLFPEALRLAEQADPAAILLENVRGLASDRFASYRRHLLERLLRLGYESEWTILNASSFNVPQLRPRFVLVALKRKFADRFVFPTGTLHALTVGEAIGDLMASRGWRGAQAWKRRAAGIAPTLVGGSKKHGGPDLGPTRAKRQWAALGVDGMGIADEAPDKGFPLRGNPRLTVAMAARVQGFPDEWVFKGKKTSAYRQVGNAFPPPVAAALGTALRTALDGVSAKPRRKQLTLFERRRYAYYSERNRLGL